MAAFATFTPEAPWPKLQWLGVSVTKDVAEGVVKAAAKFPSVKEIVVNDDAVLLCYESDEDCGSADDTNVMDTETWARLASITSGSGVHLTRGWGPRGAALSRFFPM